MRGSLAIRGVACVVVALALAGGDCKSSTATKNGKFGVQLFGGSGLVPLADAGTTVTATVFASSGGCGGSHTAATFAQVASSNPAVATFQLEPDDGTGDWNVDITTGVPGTADLELLDVDGKLVDSVAIEVEAVSELRWGARWGGTGVSSVQAIAGAPYDVYLQALDRSGRLLYSGSGGVPVSASGAVQVEPVADAKRDGEDVYFTPESGAGAVIATASDGTSAQLAVTGVDVGAIVSITLGTGDYKPYFGANDDTYVAWLVAQDDAGPVLGASCTWQVDDPAVAVSSSRGATELEDELPYINVQFKLPHPGTFTATCTIGAAQLQVPLRW